MKKTTVSFIVVVLIMLIFSLLRNYINQLNDEDLKVLIFPLFYVVLPAICAVVMFLYTKRILHSVLRIIPCFVFSSVIIAMLSGFNLPILLKEVYLYVFIFPVYFISLLFANNIHKEKNKKQKNLYTAVFIIILIVSILVLWFFSYQVIVMQTTVEYIQ